MELTCSRACLADIFDEILAVMRGSAEYAAHDPALCSDGRGLRIGSNLHEWRWTCDLDDIEEWLCGGLDDDTGRVIVAEMTDSCIARMLGIGDDVDLILR